MILGTNALFAFVDGDIAVGDILRRQPRAAIPVIVLGEFRYGIAESRHRAAYEAWLAYQLPQFDILAVTDKTSIAYAALRVALKRSGRPIPANDAWIAAVALRKSGSEMYFRYRRREQRKWRRQKCNSDQMIS